MEQENQEKLSRLQELRETMVDRQEILDHFGISDNQSTYFANELGINSESVKFGNVQTFVFYSKEDAELLKDTIQERWGNKLREVPEGYISSEKIKDILGRKFILMRVFESSVEVVGHRGFFSKEEEVLNYKQGRDAKKLKAKERREAKELAIAEIEREKEQKALDQKLKQEQWDANQIKEKKKRDDLKSKGWIGFQQAYMLGLPKDVNKYVRNKKIRHVDFEFGVHRLYNKEDVVFLADYLNKIALNSNSHNGLKVILKDKTDPYPYETRLFNLKFSKWKSDKKRLKSIATNEHYRNQHFTHNNVVHFDCTKCGAKKPYHEFHYVNSKKGRNGSCKQCGNIAYQGNKEKALANQKKNWKRPEVKMRRIVAACVQRDISFMIGNYYEVQTSTIWEAIQKQCGYTTEDLVQHIESQFDSNMNWDNHAMSTLGYRWEMDHIIARSELRYDSIQHPNFKKCWDISNLRPLNALENKSRWFDNLK